MLRPRFPFSDASLVEDFSPDGQEGDPLLLRRPPFIDVDGKPLLFHFGSEDGDHEVEASILRAYVDRHKPYMRRTIRETAGKLSIVSDPILIDKEELAQFLLGNGEFKNPWLYLAGADRIYDLIVHYKHPTNKTMLYYLPTSSSGIIEANSRFQLTKDCIYIDEGGATGEKTEKLLRAWGPPGVVQNLDIAPSSGESYDRRMRQLRIDLKLRNFCVNPTIRTNFMDTSENNIYSPRRFYTEVVDPSDPRRRVIGNLGNTWLNYPVAQREASFRQKRQVMRPGIDLYLLEADSSPDHYGLLKKAYSFISHDGSKFWTYFVGNPFYFAVTKVMHLDLNPKYIDVKTEVSEKRRGFREVSLFVEIDRCHPRLNWLPDETPYPSAEPFRDMAAGARRKCLGTDRMDEDRILEMAWRNGMEQVTLPGHEGPLRGPPDPRLPAGVNNNYWVFQAKAA